MRARRAWSQLVEVGDVRGVRRGIEVLREGHDRAMAHYAGRLRHPAFQSLLRSAWAATGERGSEAHMRFHFATALAYCGDRSARQTLRELAADPTSEQDVSSAYVLAELEQEDSTPRPTRP